MDMNIGYGLDVSGTEGLCPSADRRLPVSLGMCMHGVRA